MTADSAKSEQLIVNALLRIISRVLIMDSEIFY